MFSGKLFFWLLMRWRCPELRLRDVSGLRALTTRGKALKAFFCEVLHAQGANSVCFLPQDPLLVPKSLV